MAFPFVYGPNNIATLLSQNPANTGDIATLNLSPGGSPASTITTPKIAYLSYDPQGATIYSGVPSTLVFSQATNKWYRKFAAANTGTANLLYDQITPYIVCVASSSAGNSQTATGIYFYDFPTTESLATGTILGAGGGINATYTNTWRYQVAQPGFYLVTCMLEWANVPSSTTQQQQIFYYQTGTQTAYGQNGVGATGSTVNRTSQISYIARFTASGGTISIAAAFNASTPISQTTTAACNKISIMYMGRYL